MGLMLAAVDALGCAELGALPAGVEAGADGFAELQPLNAATSARASTVKR